MIKTMIVFVIVLMTLVSCGKSNSGPAAQNEEADYYSVAEFKTNIKLINFTSAEKVKIRTAAELLRQVVISDEFKEEVLNHEYNGRKAFANNLGLTNEQIYSRIVMGSEKLSPGKDYELDATLVAYFADVVTVGYTFPNTHKIWMNRKFFGRQDPAEVTTNLMHEWLHKLGFDHAVTATPERPYSVPYAVGYIVRRLARELY